MSDAPSEPLRTLCGFRSLAEAELVGGRLRAEGIAAVVPDQLSASIVGEFVGGRGGVRVQVPESQLEQARALLGIGPEDEPSRDRASRAHGAVPGSAAQAGPPAPRSNAHPDPGAAARAHASAPETRSEGSRSRCASCGAPRPRPRGLRRLIGATDRVPCERCGRAPGDLT